MKALLSNCVASAINTIMKQYYYRKVVKGENEA